MIFLLQKAGDPANCRGAGPGHGADIAVGMAAFVEKLRDDPAFRKFINFLWCAEVCHKTPYFAG